MDIYVRETKAVSIKLPDDANTGRPKCRLHSSEYFTLKRAYPEFYKIYLLLITAHAKEKKIYVEGIPYTDDCELSYAISYR